MDQNSNQPAQPIPEAGSTRQAGADMTPPSPAPTGGGSSSGHDEHKTWAILGYIIPLLFFIPLLSEAKHNAYAKYHANQQLNLLLYWVVGNIVLPLIPIIGWILLPFYFIFGLVLLIMGVINASKGDTKPLPLIGKLELLK